MKKFISCILVVAALAACHSSDQPAQEADSVIVEAPRYSWESEFNDSSGRLEMKKVEADGPDSLSIPAVIDFLNRNNAKVQLVFQRTSNDTIFVAIPQAMFLTQQMGSTGATYYLAEAVYNLTEVPGYKVVNFDFEEGDHAQPGPLNRDSFKNE